MIVQRCAIQKLHDIEQRVIIRTAAVVNLYGMLIVDASAKINLALKTLLCTIVIFKIVLERFDGYAHFVVLKIFGFIDDTKTAFTDASNDTVALF